MNDDLIPKNLDHFLPGMTRDFKNYVDVLPPEGKSTIQEKIQMCAT